MSGYRVMEMQISLAWLDLAHLRKKTKESEWEVPVVFYISKPLTPDAVLVKRVSRKAE